jgi:fibronectin type 3 domain-containing protein
MSVRKLLKRPARSQVFIPFTLTLITIFSILCSIPSYLHAAQVTLAWDANTDPVAGYRLYYGHTSRSYQSNVDAGNRTSYTWSGLEDGKTYYFAATAYDASNNQSDHSEELVCHTIVPSAGAGGAILPASTVFVTSGGSQTFQINPANGYQVSNVLVNGQSVGAVTSYAFNDVTAPKTISASFAPVVPTVYTITASVSGSGGSISPSGSVQVNSGGSQTFTITPANGYRVSDVVVGDTSVGAVTSYKFTDVTGNRRITASFAPITYTITASVSGSGGVISPSGKVQVNSGSSQTFTITPAANHEIDSLLVDGKSVTPGSTYTFDSVTDNRAITVSFKPLQIQEKPLADAGPDQMVAGGALVTLRGSSSTAGNGVLTYIWQQVDGKAVKLSNPSAPNPTFKAPNVGSRTASLTFRLTVTDGSKVTATDTCIVNVSAANAPPVASAGQDQTVDAWTNVTLDGSQSRDPDGAIVAYSWTQTQGPAVQINGSSQAAANFVAPEPTAAGASLVFELTVTDSAGLKATDACIVNVTWAEEPPVADAGPDSAAYEGDLVVMDGMGSFDDDGIVSYRWKQLQGVPADLVDPTSPTLQFTAPAIPVNTEALLFSLTVVDRNGLQSEDTCLVTVHKKAGVDLSGAWLTSSYDGSSFRSTLQLANHGSLKSGSFKVSFHLSGGGVTKGALLKTVPIRNIAPGATKNLSFSYRNKTLAGQTVIAEIDPSGEIHELDRDNNLAALPIQQTVFRIPRR